MPQISARVSEELADQIEAYSDETGEAKSETIRTLLQQGLEYEDVENERFRAQLAAANQRIDASNELVETSRKSARSLVSEHKLVCSRE